jgi:hypothetical protein
MKTLGIVVFLLLVSACGTFYGNDDRLINESSAYDRLPGSGKVWLYDGYRKVGWLASYLTLVMTVDGKARERRFVGNDGKDAGAILLAPGKHQFVISVADDTHLEITPKRSVQTVVFTVSKNHYYEIQLENGALSLLEWPDIPDGPGKVPVKVLSEDPAKP